MAKDLVVAGGALATLAAHDAEMIQTVIEENMNGEITAGDLDRIKMPSGGGIAWEVPSLEGPDSQKAVEGVIVFYQDQNAYWPEDSGGSSPPACVARDGKHGVGDPGGVCAVCPFNQFGSARGKDGGAGRGKACKNARIVFILQPGALLPMAMFLPPTSVPVIKKYLMRLTASGVPYYGVVSRFALEKAKNEDGTEYSKATVSAVPLNPDGADMLSRIALPADALARIRAYRDSIVPALSSVDFSRYDDIESA